MCGIAGVVDFSGRAVEPALLRRMCSMMQHRGPDDEGLHLEDRPPRASVGLGVRRLAIIDPQGGRQPLPNEDGTVWVIHNGEIYNFRELRDGLEAKGHRFRSRSDAEVIVHAYEEYGDDCVEHLDGMFAFAVWDGPRQRLLVARDRLGEKPLVYAESHGRLTFASALRPLLLDLGARPDLDPAALDVYLAYLAIPAPLTIYRGVRKLPPAHLLTFEKGVARVRRYWDLAFGPKHAYAEAEAAARLEALVTDAVRRRLVSDVAVGAFVSGGVDSSVVTGVMARLVDRPVKTFAIGFDDPDYNELPAARALARALGSDHHELVVKPTAVEMLPTIIERFGEPFGDSSALATYHLSQLTRPHVTVALTGDGGDELFAGYGRHLAARVAEGVGRIPRAVRQPLAAAARALESGSRRARRGRTRLSRLLQSAALSRADRYERWVGCFGRDLRAALYADGNLPADLSTVPQLFASVDALDAVDAMLAVDTAFYLPTDLLAKMDVMSMTHSVEARSPFLDHRVVEFAARLPSTLKLRGRRSKYLVKRAFAGTIPTAHLNAPKRGFAVPIGRWFRDELRDFVADHLLAPRARQRGLFDGERVAALVHAHLAGHADHGHHLWGLLMLELWHRAFVDGTR